MKTIQERILWMTLIWLLSLPVSAWAGGKPIGSVEYTRGAVTARAEDGALRILGKGTPLYEKDVLTTGKDSFAVIRLTDGSRITVRPDTVFGLAEYAHGAEKESALMRLFRGGLRALTGLIAKRNPNSGFRLRTATAVVGVRGTEFDARLCEGDCEAEAAAYQKSGETTPSPVVGRVVRVKGKLTARAGEGALRVLLKGGPVYEGDTLETGPGGFAVVVFRDNSRVTLQSDSRFRVDEYTYRAEKGGSAFFRLLRGGLRALTGLIAKRNAKAFKMGTPTAVVGVRGTAFDMRLCEGADCGEKPGQAKPTAGRVVRLKGALTARGPDGARRSMKRGNPVYEGDVLETGPGGYAVVVFRDDSRVTLQAGTRFKVAQYRYDTGKSGSVFFRLFRGGLRVLTGWMAKRNAKAFKIGTPTAVVGVRGTQFDIFSTIGLTEGQLRALGIDPAALGAEGGAVLWVRKGIVVSTNAAGTFEYGSGKAVFMASTTAEPFVFPAIPSVFRDNPAPVPEAIEININELFRAADDGTPRRLYVSVRDGAVVLTPEGGEALVVEKGKAAMLTGWSTRAVVLETVPDIMMNIPVPVPESEKVDMDKLFGARAQEKPKPGLYVRVSKGHVVIASDGDTLHLGRGETGFADPARNVLVRLARPPLFFINDPIPDPRHFDQWLKQAETRMGDAFGVPGGEGGEECECEIVY